MLNWFKKKKDKEIYERGENIATLDLIREILNQIQIRLTTLEVELDALKKRWKKKLVPQENSKETEPQNIYSDVLLPE